MKKKMVRLVLVVSALCLFALPAVVNTPVARAAPAAAQSDCVSELLGCLVNGGGDACWEAFFSCH